MEQEDKLLLAQIEDKLRMCKDRYIMTHTAFLDMRQASLAAERLHAMHEDFVLFGGYEDAERRILAFLPDYMQPADLAGEDSPLAVLRVSSPKGSRRLTHRDYLGSLMALGIKRDITGDILVGEDRADIIVLADMKDFLLQNYIQAGRNSLSVELLDISMLHKGTMQTRTVRDTLASLRLDGIAASAFRLSRGKAQEAIRQGLVYVNGMQILKPDLTVKEKDKITLRGKGKAVLSEIGGLSRKDRICVEFTLYN